jgi:hypothetical protein
LTSSGNEISDNVIAHFGRVGLVGSDGIKSGGVANQIHHNVIWRGSYSGIHWSVIIKNLEPYSMLKNNKLIKLDKNKNK